MNIKQVEEWVGESNITPLFTKELIEFNFIEDRFKDFNYFKDGEELVDEPFERLIRQGQLISYMYDGFWKNIDNYKDKIEIDEMYEKNNSPWILWED